MIFKEILSINFRSNHTYFTFDKLQHYILPLTNDISVEKYVKVNNNDFVGLRLLFIAIREEDIFKNFIKAVTQIEERSSDEQEDEIIGQKSQEQTCFWMK